MKWESFTTTILLLAATLSGCLTQVPSATPTASPLPTSTPTPQPEFDITLLECGYGELGLVTMSGSMTNNTSEAISFLDATVALIKNGNVVRTDQISLVNATGENAGVLDGLNYQSIAGGLAPGETLAWSIEYPLDELTQPFECEASVTSAR